MVLRLEISRRLARRLLVALLVMGSGPAVAQTNGESGGGEAQAPESASEEGETDDNGDGESGAESDEGTDGNDGGRPETQAQGREPMPETDRAAEPSERKKEIEQALERQLNTGQNQVHIYQLVEEMTDEVVADLRSLRVASMSPAAVRNVGLTPNLSSQFGEFVEATLVSAVANHTDIKVKQCQACESLRSRVEDDEWVVSMGLTKLEQLREEAERLGVDAFMDAKFSYFPKANIVAMQLEFIRADDGAVLWTETYRSDSTTAAILRTGDRIKTRKERVDELTRKIEERPRYGHMVYGGAAYIPYDSPAGGATGASLGYRLYEEFGAKRRWRYGLNAEGFGHFGEATTSVVGSFVGATLQYEVFEPDLNKPVLRTGPMVSGFVAGQQGNSAAFQWDVDLQMQFRLGAGASLMYFVPTTYQGSDLGGFGYKLRVSFNW